jgi:tellurite resistance protein
LSDLSASDRRVLLQHAVILTYIDGNQSAKEKEVLSCLVTKLRVPAEEATQILADAETRAKRLLSLL